MSRCYCRCASQILPFLLQLGLALPVLQQADVQNMVVVVSRQQKAITLNIKR